MTTQVLQNPITVSLLESLLSHKGNETLQNLKKSVLNSLNDTEESHKDVTSLGVLLLNIFLQANWTGPEVEISLYGALGEIIESEELNNQAVLLLQSNGEEIYQLVAYPILLLIAKTILVDSYSNLNLCTDLPIWSVKCIAAHLHVLEEANHGHLEVFEVIVDSCTTRKGFNHVPLATLVEFYLDCSNLYLRFYDYTKAQDCHDKVKGLLKLEISLSASLGKRTKFQYKDLPQMKLDVKFQEERTHVKSEGVTTKDLPTDVVLNDDTLLPNIRFVDSSAISNTDLSPEDQAYVIASCLYLKKTRPHDKLTHEEILPFTDSVLMAPQAWSIQFKSLFTRCITEFTNTRKMERAFNQLESLTKSFDKKAPPASERLPFLQAVDMEPKWAVKRVFAQILYATGLVDSALELFLDMHLWDDIITCYQRLGKHGKAEEVIRKQLAVKETATLWCLLGDATFDGQYYEKAWEFSKHRNARSQRSLGLMHLRKQEFAEAIPYFEKSLELNCLQPGIAFSLGCCGMYTGKLDVATKSLQKSVSLHSDNYEAWNNLASAFIKLNQLDRAYKALQEATRLSYNSWKIWENFLLVCIDIGAFDDCIHSCHRLVDLHRKEIDSMALHILVKATLENIEDFRGLPAGRLKPKLLKLFAHITSQITNQSSIWEEYATLCLHESTPSEKEKALQCLYKSHRCYTQHTDWEKSEELLPCVKRVTNSMLEVTKDVCSQADFKARAVSLYSTTKMAITNLILRLKKAYSDNNNDVKESVEPMITELQVHVNELQSLINSVS